MQKTSAIRRALRGGQRLDGHVLQQVFNDQIRTDALGLTFEIQNHAMTQHRRGDRFQIVAGDVIAFVQNRLDLGAQDQRLRAAVWESGDAVLLRRWVESLWGMNDGCAWRALADLLPGGSPQRAAAASRARALVGAELGR